MTPDRLEWWVEVAATVLLALAAVATAWSGYQASQWHGDQAVASGRATATRVESARASGLASRQVQIDVATFTQWVDAYARDDDELAALLPPALPPRVPPRLRALGRLTAAPEPRGGPDAVRAPRVPAQALQEADRLEAEAVAAGEEVKTDVERAERYVLAVVLFATALALAGIAARLRIFPVRAALLVVAWAVFLGAVAWVATFPVSV